MTEGPRPAVGAGPRASPASAARQRARPAVHLLSTAPEVQGGPSECVSQGPHGLQSCVVSVHRCREQTCPQPAEQKGLRAGRERPQPHRTSKRQGGPGSSRLKATPAAWARFCCCRHAALGVDARRSVGRSEGPDLGRCPARSPPGEWESGTSAFSFSLLHTGGPDLVVWEAVTGPDC